MNDTIAAAASGMTASGIGIIRISGPEAFSVLSKVFVPRTKADVTAYKTGTIHYGHIVNADGGIIDECLVMIMRAPHTFTTEDVAEIDSHGGSFVMQKVLEAVLAAGARYAEPGEFTKRAFLGGRIDLSEAEAVMDVIASGSEDALASSVSQLGGTLRRKVSALRETLMTELAFIEAALDDPEHYDLSAYSDTLLSHTDEPEREMRALLASFAKGRFVREGILTVILGKPNAGKSSVLNALLGRDRAIVTDIAGTTRDVIEEQVNLGGLTLRILDTAGIHTARDAIEEIGIERSREAAQEADLLLAVFDGSAPLDASDIEILSMVRGRQAVILLNKNDLPQVVSAEDLKTYFPENIPEILCISAKDGEGIDALTEAVRQMFFGGTFRFREETVLTNGRHAEAVRQALSSLSLVREAAENGMPEDLIAIDLMDACTYLGEITGETARDDLIDTIFSKFCMGK